jgi:hypothetical protein
MSAVLVFRLLSAAAAAARRQPVAVVIEYDGPVAVRAAVAALAGLLSDVMCCHGTSINDGCEP